MRLPFSKKKKIRQVLKTAFERVLYIVWFVSFGFLIASGILFFLEAARASENPNDAVNFLWQIVLLGIIAGTAFVCLPKTEFTDASFQKRVFLSGLAALLSTVIMLFGTSVSYIAFRQGHYQLMSAGGVITAIGIIILSVSFAVASVECVRCLYLHAKGFVDFE